MAKISNILKLGLTFLLSSTSAKADYSLEEITLTNKPYSLYDYDTSPYLESINRQRVIDIIQDLACEPKNNDPLTYTLNFINENFVYTISYVKDSLNKKDIIYILENDLKTSATTIIFDELNSCNERYIDGYFAVIELSELINKPSENYSALINSYSDIGPLAELIYGEFVEKLERYISIKKLKN